MKALDAVKKFHGRTLDGVPMEVKLAGKDGKENPFNPFEVKMNSNSQGEGKNI